MKKIAFITLFIFVNFKTIGQISVQTVAYWDLHEEYEYSGTYSNYKIKNQDTTYISKILYDVSVKVIDQTDSTYTVDWKYNNHKLIKGSEIIRKLSEMGDTIHVVIKTDELGAFIEIVNMEELLNFYEEKFLNLENKYSEQKELLNIINLTKKKFQNPTYIANNSIKDLLTFYTFHGAKYDLNEEYNGLLKTANNFDANAPFETETVVWLDEIDSENNNYILRSTQKIKEDQLKLAVAKKTGLAMDSIKDLTHETFVGSRIHGSGWTTFMIFTREVKSMQNLTIEEYTLQMK